MSLLHRRPRVAIVTRFPDSQRRPPADVAIVLITRAGILVAAAEKIIEEGSKCGSEDDNPTDYSPSDSTDMGMA
jgi:hypothetical protein